MPFLAESSSGIVVPEEVSKITELSCLNCDEELCVRERHERNGAFVARHFWHVNGSGRCPGGESETHRRLKSIILSKLKHHFPYQDAGLEKTIGRRIADVYLEFEYPLDKMGDGIVVEVQHKNEDKPKAEVINNYLQEGFSVCWIEDAEIDGRDVDLADPEWVYPGDVQYYYEGDQDLEEIPSNPDCLNCVATELSEVHNRDHAYRNGDLYQCPKCGQLYIESGRNIERVPHRGNISERDIP